MKKSKEESLKETGQSMNLNIAINLGVSLIILIISLLRHNITIIFFLNLILISSLNIAFLNRVKYSLDLLIRLKKLEEVDFPKFKDMSMILLGILFALGTYFALALEALGRINLQGELRANNLLAKGLLYGIILLLFLWAFITNISGVIVTENITKGRRIFDLKDNSVALGSEAISRATGSFKEGIILGYYIFYFKNIKNRYRDKEGNIVLEGYDGGPFKIIIEAKRSKKYFSKLLKV